MIFEMLDAACAETLGVDVDTFVRVIEKTTEFRREAIITQALAPDNDKKRDQVKRVFKELKRSQENKQ